MRGLAKSHMSLSFCSLVDPMAKSSFKRLELTYSKGWFHTGYHVPSTIHVTLLASPNMKAKSQLWASIKTFKTYIIYINWSRISIVLCIRFCAGLVSRVGLVCVLNLTLTTSPEPHLQWVLPCRHPRHTWDPCEVASPKFHALYGWCSQVASLQLQPVISRKPNLFIYMQLTSNSPQTMDWMPTTLTS